MTTNLACHVLLSMSRCRAPNKVDPSDGLEAEFPYQVSDSS